MSLQPPPNPALAELLEVIGEENTQEIVRIFLQEAPQLLESLSASDRPVRHRAAHSLKSSARLVGAETVANHAARLELLLSKPEGEISPADISGLAADLSTVSPALIAFAGN